MVINAVEKNQAEKGDRAWERNCCVKQVVNERLT